MNRLAIPISKADLAHYHGDLVIVTALALATATELEWAALTQRSRARWLDRSVDLLVAVLSDTAVVQRLPLLYDSLSWRMDRPKESNGRCS